ncbi:hypothetical protein WJX75_002197 [Coccomyxa subellipsoidea]|uniref:Uncharacterized protein n=1 Tax=Coccomyxa subellipsoidea TaxID=248742 RepID=A0ABR2Z0X3_9CHLO
MSYFNPNWPQRRNGTGDLDDMEAILSSPGQIDGQRRATPTISVPVLGTYEKMTVAASLMGAVAGGAAAGPLGVSVGAKSGALMVAAGAGICGAAQHCYAHGLPVGSVGSSLADMSSGLLANKPEAPNDGLPTSFSASQQLTPRRSQDGGQA